MDAVNSGEKIKSEELAYELTDSLTNADRRLQIAKVLFPSERKNTLLNSAGVNRKGRHVSYFRLMGYGELNTLLTKNEVLPDGQPQLNEKFNSNVGDIKFTLQRELHTLPTALHYYNEEELKELMENFTRENYTKFVTTKIPRKTLFKLHIRNFSSTGNINGIISASVGAPMEKPYDPSPQRRGSEAGIPVVEMVIPNDQIFVHPLFVEYPSAEFEKEVELRKIKKEWVVDIYQGGEDFSNRFIANPNYPVYPFYQKLLEEQGEYTWIPHHAQDLLMQWKKAESIADLVPVSKLKEIESDNPELDKPLVS